MNKAIFFLGVALLVLLATNAIAEVPQMINYQGQLTDNAGVALDTTVSITFTIYDDSTSAGPVWTETQPAVQVSDGMFAVILGTVVPIDDSVFSIRVFVDPDRFLGIAVGADPEIEPRTRLVSVPYSHVASTVNLPLELHISGSDYYENGMVWFSKRDEDGGGDTTEVYFLSGQTGLSIYDNIGFGAIYSESGKYAPKTSCLITSSDLAIHAINNNYPVDKSSVLLALTDTGGVAYVISNNTSSVGFLAMHRPDFGVSVNTIGYLAGDSVGVFGHAENSDDYAILGENSGNACYGYIGGGYNGVFGSAYGGPTEVGVRGEHVLSGNSGYIGGDMWAGYFDGDVQVDGEVRATFYYGDGSNLTGIAGGSDDDWTIDGDDIYHETGNVGIGTTTPNGPLHVESGMSIANSGHFDNREAPLVVGDADGDGSGACLLIDGNQIEQATGYKLSINAISPEDVVMVVGGGDVGIGTNTPAYKLDVNGDINVSGSYNVKKNGVNYSHPDYVFEPDYKLMSLDDLKKYVTTHKHLPNVISADEVRANDGFKLDELLIQMLEKIEEQTLYILQLEEKTKEVNELKAEVAQLSGLVEKILAQQNANNNGNGELAVDNK